MPGKQKAPRPATGGLWAHSGSPTSIDRHRLRFRDALALVVDPRERRRHFNWLGRDLLAENVLEDRAVDLLDLDHRVRGHHLVNAPLVAERDLAPAVLAIEHLGAWGVR